MIRVVLAAAVAAAVVLSTVAGSHLTPPTQALEYSGATARGVRGHGAAVDSSPGSRGAGTKAVQRNSWVQDRLAIGFWVDPVVPPSEFQQRYAEIASANFTFVMGGFGATNVTAVKAQLAACEANGLRAVVHAANATLPQLPMSSALWGYQLFDEPGFQDFDMLGELVHNISLVRPNVLPFINLLPNTDKWFLPPYVTPNSTYPKYVSKFLDAVDVPVVSFDHYPVYQLGVVSNGTVVLKDTREDYLSNLDLFRNVSLARGVAYWNFFNTMPFDSNLDPTEDLVRWQVFASLAYGSKGFLYFCYWTPVSGEFPTGGAIMRPEGPNGTYVRGPHYEHARRINSVLVAWEPILLRAVSTGRFRITPGADAAAALQGCMVLTNMSSHHTWMPQDFIVGQFRLEDGRDAALVVNNAVAFSAWPTLTFAGAASPSALPILEVDPSTGVLAPVLDDSPRMPGLQQSFSAAHARLYVVGDSPP